MFTFGTITFLIFVGAFAWFFYEIFLEDFIDQKRKASREKDLKLDSANKIAKVKLVSDNQKDIEKFITDNAQYLSDEMVSKLVERMEAIKADHVINADTILKQRIDALEPLEVEEEEPVIVKRASRRK